jgi:hypothetical protein
MKSGVADTTIRRRGCCPKLLVREWYRPASGNNRYKQRHLSPPLRMRNVAAQHKFDRLETAAWAVPAVSQTTCRDKPNMFFGLRIERVPAGGDNAYRCRTIGRMDFEALYGAFEIDAVFHRGNVAGCRGLSAPG